MKSEKKPEVPATAAPTPFTPIDQHLFESRTVFVSGEVNAVMVLLLTGAGGVSRVMVGRVRSAETVTVTPSPALAPEASTATAEIW